MVGGHIYASDRFTAGKERVVPAARRLRGPPIVSRTSEEKNVNTPTLWNTSNMTRYELVKSYDLLSRPSLNSKDGNSEYQRLLCQSTLRHIPEDISSSNTLKPLHIPWNRVLL